VLRPRVCSRLRVNALRLFRQLRLLADALLLGARDGLHRCPWHGTVKEDRGGYACEADRSCSIGLTKVPCVDVFLKKKNQDADSALESVSIISVALISVVVIVACLSIACCMYTPPSSPFLSCLDT
jgi:hypothetical protein